MTLSFANALPNSNEIGYSRGPGPRKHEDADASGAEQDPTMKPNEGESSGSRLENPIMQQYRDEDAEEMTTTDDDTTDSESSSDSGLDPKSSQDSDSDSDLDVESEDEPEDMQVNRISFDRASRAPSPEDEDMEERMMSSIDPALREKRPDKGTKRSPSTDSDSDASTIRGSPRPPQLTLTTAPSRTLVYDPRDPHFIYLAFYRGWSRSPFDMHPHPAAPQRFLVAPSLRLHPSAPAHALFLRKQPFPAKWTFSVHDAPMLVARGAELEAVLRLGPLPRWCIPTDAVCAARCVRVPRYKVGYTYMTWVSDVIDALIDHKILSPSYVWKGTGRQILSVGMKFCRAQREKMKLEGYQSLPAEWVVPECDIRGRPI